MGLFNKLDIELNYFYLCSEYLETDEDYLEFYVPESQQKGFLNDFTNYVVAEGDISEDAILQTFQEWVETEITNYDGYIEVVVNEGCEEYYDNKPWCKITRFVPNENIDINSDHLSNI